MLAARSSIRRCFSTSSTTLKSLKIGLIPGDGIGREVIPAGKAVLENLPAKHDLQFEFVNLDAGFELFKKTGTALPDETVDVLKRNVMVHCLGLFHRQPLKLLDTLPQLLH